MVTAPPRPRRAAGRRPPCRRADTPSLAARRYDRTMLGTDPAVAALARCPLFAGLDGSGLAGLAAEMRARRFRRNEVLFHQGDPGDALFVVTRGAVKISLPNEEGDEAIIATIREGEFFGELALLDGAPR